MRTWGGWCRTEGTVVRSTATTIGRWRALLSAGKTTTRSSSRAHRGNAKVEFADIHLATRCGPPGSRSNTARPPFNAGFELLVANSSGRAGGAAGSGPPAGDRGDLSGLLLVGFFLWSRERRLRGQRRRLRRTYQLGEEILSAASAATILKRISEALPSILGMTRVAIVRLQSGGQDRWMRSETRTACRHRSRFPPRRAGRRPARWPASITARLLVIPGYRTEPVPDRHARRGSAAPRACCSSP